MIAMFLVVMERTSDYRLTIRYWPRAAEAGVRPEAVFGFRMDDSPALYRPYEFDFSHPPSRDDLLAVAAQTPWMADWRETILRVIEVNQWPMLTFGFKAASVDLKDAKDRVVGRVEVWRKDRYVNRPYSVPFVGVYPGSDIDRHLSRRFRLKAKRGQALEHVAAHRHLILERIARDGDTSESRLLAEVDRVLDEVGFASMPKRRRVRRSDALDDAAQISGSQADGQT